jgi:hypothetical protein
LKHACQLESSPCLHYTPTHPSSSPLSQLLQILKLFVPQLPNDSVADGRLIFDAGRSKSRAVRASRFANSLPGKRMVLCDHVPSMLLSKVSESWIVVILPHIPSARRHDSMIAEAYLLV